MRLIDADALINRIVFHSDLSFEQKEAFEDEINAEPSIQTEYSNVQEIIRCEDCKHVRKWGSEESAKKFGQVYECARGVFRCPEPGDFVAMQKEEPMDDLISRRAVLDGKMVAVISGQAINVVPVSYIKTLPSEQPDVVTASLKELINNYGEDGYSIVDGVSYQAKELLNELKINSSVGEKFRKQIFKTIVQYFMKFGG